MKTKQASSKCENITIITPYPSNLSIFHPCRTCTLAKDFTTKITLDENQFTIWTELFDMVYYKLSRTYTTLALYAVIVLMFKTFKEMVKSIHFFIKLHFSSCRKCRESSAKVPDDITWKSNYDYVYPLCIHEARQ